MEMKMKDFARMLDKMSLPQEFTLMASDFNFKITHILFSRSALNTLGTNEKIIKTKDCSTCPGDSSNVQSILMVPGISWNSFACKKRKGTDTDK
jgi:hypothetical protein